MMQKKNLFNSVVFTLFVKTITRKYSNISEFALETNIEIAAWSRDLNPSGCQFIYCPSPTINLNSLVK